MFHGFMRSSVYRFPSKTKDLIMYRLLYVLHWERRFTSAKGFFEWEKGVMCVVYGLRRFRSGSLKGALFFWGVDTDEQHFLLFFEPCLLSNIAPSGAPCVLSDGAVAG